MMPARLGEGVIAMLPRSSWLTITPAPGRSCARSRGGGRGRNLALFGAAVGQVLAASYGPHTRAQTQGSRPRRAASRSTGGRKIWRGTDGSNPSLSSGESVANLKGPFDAWWHRETDEQGRSVVPFRLLQLAEQGWSECGAVYGVPTRDSKNFWSCGIPARGAGFLRAGKHGLVRAGRP